MPTFPAYPIIMYPFSVPLQNNTGYSFISTLSGSSYYSALLPNVANCYRYNGNVYTISVIPYTGSSSSYLLNSLSNSICVIPTSNSGSNWGYVSLTGTNVTRSLGYFTLTGNSYAIPDPAPLVDYCSDPAMTCLDPTSFEGTGGIGGSGTYDFGTGFQTIADTLLARKNFIAPTTGYYDEIVIDSQMREDINDSMNQILYGFFVLLSIALLTMFIKKVFTWFTNRK